jgi:hypothetical protein
LTTSIIAAQPFSLFGPKSDEKKETSAGTSSLLNMSLLSYKVKAASTTTTKDGEKKDAGGEFQGNSNS